MSTGGTARANPPNAMHLTRSTGTRDAACQCELLRDAVDGVWILYNQDWRDAWPRHDEGPFDGHWWGGWRDCAIGLFDPCPELRIPFAIVHTNVQPSTNRIDRPPDHGYRLEQVALRGDRPVLSPAARYRWVPAPGFKFPRASSAGRTCPAACKRQW